MQSRTVEQVESWDARPFSGGVRELHELADDGFSGTVTADDTWVFFLNGRVIGVFQGELADVAESNGTTYTAPHPSLPLLFTMQERGGKTQAKYFTNDTSIEAADETLRDANFTGYLELSENVLSGDYYVTYYGGKSMSTAFVGQSERLEVGEEAFELANDEVGVFEVRKVSMTITELPPLSDADDSSGSGDDESGTAGPAVAPGSSDEPEGGPSTDAVEDAEPEPARTPDDDAEPPERPIRVEEAESSSDGHAKGTSADDSPSSPASAEQSTADTDTADLEPSTADTEAADSEPSTADTETADSEPSTADTETADSELSSADTETAGADQSAVDIGSADPEEPTDGPSRENEQSATSESMTDHERAVREWAAKDRSERDDAENQDLFREEAQWRKTKSIPALDPDESETAHTRGAGSGRRATTSESSKTSDTGKRTDSTEANSSRTRPARSSASAGRSQQPTETNTQLAKLEAAVEERDRRIETLESELSAAESERNELDASVAELREERAELQDRLETLESKLESAENGASTASVPRDTDVTPGEALAGTNLFIRYDSKGKATLDSLEGSSIDPDAVNENLRLDYHTRFDAEETTVAGTSFDRFLHDSSRFRFVEWLVRELPYELLDSGTRSGLQDVYDAIPAFDRVEFDGTVDVESESGETATHAFDVVVRDRMGEPLVVADLNDSRDPVPVASMERLVTGATDLGETVDSLAGAFYVTASYFEPAALERAQEAASAGGFFSRNDRESYVKVSRKNGYHLCLVEDRRDAFHLTVPEL